MVDMMKEEARTCAVVDAAKPKRFYAVRVEWPTFSYVDVAVEAGDPEEACRVAFEEADYEDQREYDEPGDSFVSCIVQRRTLGSAQRLIASRGIWDHSPGLAVPLKHREDSEQRHEIAKQLRAALQAFLDWNDEDKSTRYLEHALNRGRAAIAAAEAAGIK